MRKTVIFCLGAFIKKNRSCRVNDLSQENHIIFLKMKMLTVLSFFFTSLFLATAALAGSATNPNYTFSSSTNTGIFDPGANIFGISTSGAERVRVDASGNVGIGTISPGQKLSVVGTVESTSGGFKFPDGSIQATANQPFVIGGTFVGVLGNAQVLTQLPLPINVTVPAGCTNSRFEFVTAATASTTISLQKCTGAGFTSCTQFGTAVISAAGKVASFTCASATSFTAGTDSILITGPATADTTAATAGWAIYGTR